MPRSLNVFFAICVAIVPSIASPSSPATAVELPRSTIDTTLSATPITGRRIVVSPTADIDSNGQALQKAIDNAQYGDVVVVQAGAIYRTGSLELRNKSGAGWITIESSDIGSLPAPGTRVGPQYSSHMPTLISPGGNDPVILTEPGAHNYRLIGLEVTKLDPASFVQEMIVIDASFDRDPADSPQLSDFPSSIIVDRCYIHGLPKSDLKRGIRLHCFDCAVVDSYISDAHVLGQDSQAIFLGGRTIKIDNNYMEGAGENIFAADYFSLKTASLSSPATTTTAQLSMLDELGPGSQIAFFDGKTNLTSVVKSVVGNVITFDALPNVPSSKSTAYWGQLPTDVEISRNYIFKPLTLKASDPSFAGYQPTVKNLLELKSGVRVYIHDNVLVHSWTEGQSGYAVLFTVKNEYDKCYFCAVKDVLFEKNIIQDTDAGLNLLNTDYADKSGTADHIIVRNNLWLDVKDKFQVGALSDLIIDHNTAFIGSFVEEFPPGLFINNQVTNNIMLSTNYSGFHIDDGSTPAWFTLFPNWVVERNLLSKIGSMSAYWGMPQSIKDSNQEVSDTASVGFANPSAGDYTLLSTSIGYNYGTDGQSIGADTEYLQAQEPHVVAGEWSAAGSQNPGSGDGGTSSPKPPSSDKENLAVLWLDKSYLLDSSLPTTIGVQTGKTLGIAHLAWNASPATKVEVRLAAPAGALLATGGPKGTATTGECVKEGTIFFLQDASSGNSTDPSNTIATLMVHTKSVGFDPEKPLPPPEIHLPPRVDFDGDDKTDFVVWRPASGTWYIIPSSRPTQPYTQQWGFPGDIPAAGDFDGDGITDFVVWRPAEGNWYVIPSSRPSEPYVQQWGLPGDIPMAADIDGDGICDFVVWRPSNGTWYVIPSQNPSAPIIQQWGLPGDMPLIGDFDGDGRVDYAVWRPSNGTWYVILSTNPAQPMVRQWGLPGDVPVITHFQGAKANDIAVWRPASGMWYIEPVENPNAAHTMQWGLPGDIPVPDDFDVDRKTDFAIWRPSEATLYIKPSSNPGAPYTMKLGAKDDVLVPNSPGFGPFR